MTSPSDASAARSQVWTRKHLLGLEDLTAEEITLILDQAAEFKKCSLESNTKLDLLSGTVVANLFFEPSTRTRTSFALAAKRLSADTIDFTASNSSLSKGETFIDTARNIEAMGASLVVMSQTGTELFPPVDAGQFTIYVRAPSGTRIEKSEELVEAVENEIVAVIGDPAPGNPAEAIYPVTRDKFAGGQARQLTGAEVKRAQAASNCKMLISNIGVLTALAAGAISFLSPCVLPLVPGYVSYIAGQPDLRTTRSVGLRARAGALGLSACFVLGFSTVFVALGAGASALGSLLLTWRSELNFLGGAIIILFGLVMLGVFRLETFSRDTRFNLDIPGGRPFGAYVLGLAFAFGWTPCIGPILGAILTLSSTSGGMSDGIWLLSIYSAGLGVPFLLAALFTDAIAARVRQIGKAGRWLYKGAGVAMIIMGIAIMTGQLSRFAYWLLGTFPFLATIG